MDNCVKFDVNIQTPNGAQMSISYSGPNNRAIDRMAGAIEGYVNNYNNSLTYR
jgi:hypothetical protein